MANRRPAKTTLSWKKTLTATCAGWGGFALISHHIMNRKRLYVRVPLLVLILGSAVLLNAADNLPGPVFTVSAVTNQSQTGTPTPEEIAEYDELWGLQLFEEHKYTMALEKFRRAAVMGRAKAQYYLGHIYSSGLGVQESYSEGAKWYAKAVRRGYLPAFSLLANRYRFGNGVEKNPSEAVRLSHIAAELGNADAQFELGQCYQGGEGVSKDALEAEKWYRRAADQGNSEGYSQLASMYSNRALVLTQRLIKEAESTWSPDSIDRKYRSD